MSFDLALVGGDISFGVDGNPVTVVDSAKLAQDVSKISMTPIGTDPGNANYGTKFRGILGKAMDFSTVQGLAARTEANALSLLQSIQAQQSAVQTLTYLETIGNVDAIAVVQTAGSGIQVQVAITSVAGLRQVFVADLSGKNNT